MMKYNIVLFKVNYRKELQIKMEIFLESNVFVEQCFNFSEGSKLDRLKKLAKEHNIKLLSSSIVVNECKDRIRTELDLSFPIINKLPETNLVNGSNRKIRHAWTILKNDPEYKNHILSLEKFKNENKANVINLALQQFDNYIDEAKIELIDITSVSLSEIVEDYFNYNPPFEIKKNKRNEFPDAIMAKSIINYKNSTNEDLVVVSNDGGFIKSLSDQPLDGLEIKDTIRSLLDYLYLENELIINRSISYMLKDISYMLNDITDAVISKAKNNEVEIEVDGLHTDSSGGQYGHEYEDIEIVSAENLTIDLQNAYVINVDGSYLELEAEAQMNVSIAANFMDEEQSYWDSEEKSYFKIHYGKAFEKHDVPFICKISVEYDGKDLIFESVDYTLDLNYYTLNDVEYS